MVKTLFDTSVLVAALWVDHPVHPACRQWVRQVKIGNIQGVIVIRTLAELYSSLTALPIKHRLAPSVTQQLMGDNLAQFEIIPLTVEDYQTVIERMVALNLTGGGIYDALIAQVALKAEVDRLLTLNPKHFTRLGDSIAQLVTIPQ